MKKATKCLLGGALVILFLTPVSQVKADWHQDNIGWWYSLNNGSYYKNQEVDINGKDYKFDSRGYMITGWQYNVYNDGDYSGWYYYDPVTGEEKRGWQLIDGKWYYLSEFGARFGAQNINGKHYYFDPVNSDMQTGWISKQGYPGLEWYYYNPESGEQLSGWQEIDGKKYYLTSNGAYSGHIYTIDGKRYYFDPVTRELITGWFELYGSKYYADPNDGGALASNKTLVIDGVSYSFYESGTLITDEP